MKRPSSDQLMLLLSTICSKTNRVDLLNTITEQVKPLFDFYDTGILIIDEIKDTFYDFSAVHPEIDHSEVNFFLNKKGFYSTIFPKYTGSYLAFAVQELKSKGPPVLLSLDEDQISKYTDYALLKNLQAGGYRTMMAGLLESGNKIIGVFTLNYLDETKIQKIDATLFKNVVHLLSIAVANILANEELLAREKEKELLYNIASAIANIQDRISLMKFILHEVKQVFNFYDVGLVVLNPDGINGIDWAIATPQIDPSLANYESHRKKLEIIPHRGTLLEKSVTQVEQSGKPLIVKFNDQLLADNPDLRPVFEVEKKHGYKEILFTYLKCGEKLIGTFNLNSIIDNHFQAAQFTLFQAVADQIAVAVSNILAKEEILAREREKSILLSISEAINKASTPIELLKAIREKVNTLLNFHDTGIIIVEPNGAYHYDLAVNYEGWDDSSGNIKLRNKGLNRLKHPKSYIDFVMQLIKEQGQPLIEALDERYEEFDYPFFPIIKEIGYRESMVSILSAGDSIIGTFWLNSLEKNNFQETQFPVFQAVTEQISVALVNILSREAIAEREKQKQLEIRVNNAIISSEPFEKVMNDIAQSISDAVGADLCYIQLFSERLDLQPFQFYCEKVAHQYHIQPISSKAEKLGKSISILEEQARSYLNTVLEPQIVSGSTLEDLNLQQSYIQDLCTLFKVRSFLFLPLQLRSDCQAYLVLGSKMAYAYIDSDLDLVKGLSTQLSLALDSRLAFRQVQLLNEMIEQEKRYLIEEIKESHNFNEIVGNSESLRTVFNQVDLVATTDTTVLIGGETGTGKELIARAIHERSKRKNNIMIKLNCASLPATLIESELFGHEKGAFTGAIERRIGKFELANGGSIFLDEIGELPLELQAKLLRVIQEREFERIGGKQTLKTDIRIIAATNKNLALESAEKRFRNDLYYRLNVFSIHLPALRERKEDIPLLAFHFIKKFSNKLNKKISSITNEALEEMMAYHWPGNVRELEHVIEHSVICCTGPKLSLGKPLLAEQVYPSTTSDDLEIKSLQEHEREYIIAVLKHCGGRIRGQGGAAQLLDIHPNTLESRMSKLGIKKEHVWMKSS